MTSIVIVLPKIEDAKGIKSLLVRSGYSVSCVGTSGAQALNALDYLDDGIVICGFKLTDMLYSELYQYLPKGFEMLLLASPHLLKECVDNDIMCLSMPLAVRDLINTVELMTSSIAYKRKKRKAQPKERNVEEKNIINEAKSLLIDRNNMSEGEAHRYIQKCSMDSSTTMVEMAKMILTTMR